MIVVVMGVTGCGKSTVGAALARRLGCRFLDADDFHPPANVEKMRAGAALDDADRWPWLDTLARELRSAAGRGEIVVLACSALKAVYRERLAAAAPIRFVHLTGDERTIAARLAGRAHRYMPASLLASQFAALEAPSDALAVAVDLPVETQVDAILRGLGASSAARTGTA